MSANSQNFPLSPVLESMDDKHKKESNRVLFKQSESSSHNFSNEDSNNARKSMAPQFSSEEETEFDFEEEEFEAAVSSSEVEEKLSEKMGNKLRDADDSSVLAKSIGNLHLIDDNESTTSDSKSFRGRPSSCVFVASLASLMTDDHLCMSVTKHFEKWGELVTVKVLRDPSNRPYAFVQYTNDNDAQKAIAEGQHSILDGRTIRCEAARVNRTLYLSTSADILEEDVRERLETFGEIEQLVSNEYGDYNNYRTGAGRFTNITKKNFYKAWFCKFAYRDNAIRAYANLRANPEWIVEWAQNLDPPPFEAKEEVTIDKYSVFVGQLYATVTKDELVKRFETHGKVVEAILVTRPNNNFAFVKYESEASAAAAVERENHSIFEGKTMHVQYREIHHHHYNSNKNKRSNEPRLSLAPPPINLPTRRSSTGSGQLNTKLKASQMEEHSLMGHAGNGYPMHTHMNPNPYNMMPHNMSSHQNMKRSDQFNSGKNPMGLGKFVPSYGEREYKDSFKYVSSQSNGDDSKLNHSSKFSAHKSKRTSNSNKGSDDEGTDTKVNKNDAGSANTPTKYTNSSRKEHSPVPSSSNRTTNSPTASKSLYSPSSAINSEQLEDQFNPSLKYDKRSSISAMQTNPPTLFYYVPSKEAYDGIPPNMHSYYYNPFQYYPHYDMNAEFSQTPGMAPYFMYYPTIPMSQGGGNADPMGMMMGREHLVQPMPGKFMSGEHLPMDH